MPTVPAEIPCPAPPHRAGPAQPGVRNPNLLRAPRCGARTRAGCPCQAPAIRGRARCRMHGGRSTGPRTPEGLARLRAARTTHGDHGAEALLDALHASVMTRRIRVLCAAIDLLRWLPPDMAARLEAGAAPELGAPPHPAWGKPPFAGTQGVRGRAAVRAAARVEAASLAPWRAAIAAAREARKAEKAQGGHATDGPRAAAAEIAPEPLAPEPGDLARRRMLGAVEAELARRRGMAAGAAVREDGALAGGGLTRPFGPRADGGAAARRSGERSGDFAQGGHAPDQGAGGSRDCAQRAHATERVEAATGVSRHGRLATARGAGAGTARPASDAGRPGPGWRPDGAGSRGAAGGLSGAPRDASPPKAHAPESRDNGIRDFAQTAHAPDTAGGACAESAQEPHATEADLAAPARPLNRAERRRLKALRRRWERRGGGW
jgi:hypothetical protein